MNTANDYESRLWSILAKEDLVDLSQFHKGGFLDEVPLYSRESDIEFLAGLPGDEADRVLLVFALKFLKAVVAYHEHRSQFVAAITVWNPGDFERVVPNLFVCSGSIRKLRSKLSLDLPTTPFAKRIKRLTSPRLSHNGLELFQDTQTLTNETRVFVSLSQRPYESFVPLHEFCKSSVFV